MRFEQKEKMKIKYDKNTKTVTIVLFIIGVFLLILSSVLAGIFDRTTSSSELYVLCIMGLYIGSAFTGIGFFGTIGAYCYFIRLKAYGYVIPDNKKEYDNNLEELTRACDGDDNKKKLIDKIEKITSNASLVVLAVFLCVDFKYYLDWKFMDASLVVFLLISDLSIVIFYFVFNYQRKADKYREDVECEKNKKVKTSFDQAIGILFFLLGFCLVVYSLVISMTRYFYLSRLQAYNAELKHIGDVIIEKVDTEYNDTESYKELLEGANILAWGEPKDDLQIAICEDLGVEDFKGIIKHFYRIDNDEEVFVCIREDSVEVKLRNYNKKYDDERYPLEVVKYKNLEK